MIRVNLSSLIAGLLLLALAGCATPLQATPTPTVTTPPPAAAIELPLPASELIAQAVSALERSETFRFEMSVSTDVVGVDIGMNATGMVQQPGKTYMTMSAIGRTFEMLTLSEDEVYSRSSPEDPWEPADMQAMNRPQTGTDLFDQLQLADFIRSATAESIEEVSGVSCYRLAVVIDTYLYYKSIDPSGQHSPTDMSPINGWAWVNVNEPALCKIQLKMPISFQGMSIQTDFTMRFFDWNQPLDFPKP